MDANEILEAMDGMDPATWKFWVKFVASGSLEVGAPFILLSRGDLEKGTLSLSDVLMQAGLLPSRSQCLRKMKENAITVWGPDGKKLTKFNKDRAAVEDDFRGGVIVGTKSDRFVAFVH